MQCVELNWIPLPDGSNATVLSPVWSSPEGCDMVVVSHAEWLEVSASPFKLSTEDGLLVAGAISSLWCLAWAIRAVRKALD